MPFKWPLYRYFGAKVYTIWVHGPLNPISPINPRDSLKEPLKEPYYGNLKGTLRILCRWQLGSLAASLAAGEPEALSLSLGSAIHGTS